MSVTLSWGKCTVSVKSLTDSDAVWTAFTTPVEDSTTLETEEGDKLEAKIEGGENEAVKYKKSTYTLDFETRQAPEREDPITGEDGVVEGEYAVLIVPEDDSAYNVYIPRAACSIQKSFTAEEGIKYAYHFDALVPDDGGEAVRQLTTAEVEEIKG